MRFFNTAGVCFPDRHYMLPPEPRLPQARRLVDQGEYFVLHAPRQTGKTTTLIALARSLTAEGRYAALYASCEAGRVADDDYAAAQQAILSDIRFRAETDLPVELRPPRWPEASDTYLLQSALTAWARACPRPLVLLLDEIDGLARASLYSVLSQLRGGATRRPAEFPHCVAVCGLRDVRDYKRLAGGDPTRSSGTSPFNIKTESLRLGDFTAAEVAELYAQHTAETGQAFTDEAMARAFDYTQGQPWLVNALAKQVTEKMEVALPEPITAAHIDQAKERLILARQTHLDSLVDKLYEPRVKRVIEPIIAGDHPDPDPTYNEDVSYLRDLGLLARDRPVRIANPIYREVIVRVLGEWTEDVMDVDPRSFVLPDGRLDFRRLLEEFAAFWCQHAEILERQDAYHEAAPHLVLMGFLHRIVVVRAVSEAERSGAERSSGPNGSHCGGGQVEREYGMGRGRIDLIVRWPYPGPDGKRAEQREPVELKVWRTGKPDPLAGALTQLDKYLDRMQADRGTLVIFDRRSEAPAAAERTRFAADRTPTGRPVTLLRA